MKRFLIVLTIAIYGINAKAQTTEDSVKAVINKLFTAMKNADGEMLKSCFSESMVLQSISVTKEGKTVVSTEKGEDFVASISGLAAGDADEQIVYDAIKVDGALAFAWTPYKFFYKNKFSHCGVNSFQLVRFNGEWKIQYIIDTRRRAGCE